jgi:error-prone DNA polymerase
LLTYASCWLKCHEPAAFACALINSWPMGFYSPDQILQDARRHRLQMRPVDVLASDWDCSLEPIDGAQPAIRLGLRMIKGFREEDARRIEAARQRRSATSPTWTRAPGWMPAQALLADAGPCGPWPVIGIRRAGTWRGCKQLGLFAGLPSPDEAAVELPAPTVGEDLQADYATVGTTLGPHPLALLRAELRNGAAAARTNCWRWSMGRSASPGWSPPATGHRQRRDLRHPGRRVRQRQRGGLARSGRTSARRAGGLAAAQGRRRWEAVGEVRHLIAGRLTT